MSKYKLLTQTGWPNLEKGKIYDEDFLVAGIKISRHVANYPRDWELVKEFPKKWKINVHGPHAREIQKWIRETYPYDWSFANEFYGNAESYLHDFDFTGAERFLKDHEEITYEQFLTHVIKNKTIYKIKSEYAEFAFKLLDSDLTTFDSISIYFDKLSKAGVLDIWCEIAPKYTLPKILGYDGEDLGDSVKYGCQTRKVEWVKKLYKSMQEFDLTFIEISSKYVVAVDNIKQVVEYFENK